MRIFRKALSTLIFGFFTIQNNSAPAQTIGHEILKMEFEVGADDLDLNELNKWLEGAITEEKLKPSTGNENRSEARKKLAAVHRYLSKIKSRPYMSTLLFHSLFRTGSGDCDVFAFYYLSLAERLNWPLAGVLLPDHIFVRWTGKNFTIGWDTNVGREQDEMFYRRNGLIHPQAVTDGVYLVPLSRREVLAVAKFNVAHRFAERKNFLRALELASETIEIFPNHAAAYVFRGSCLEKLGREDEAKQEYSKAFMLDPVLKELYESKKKIKIF